VDLLETGHRGAEFLLGLLPFRDILDDGDVLDRLRRAFREGRQHHVPPDQRAVLTAIPFLVHDAFLARRPHLTIRVLRYPLVLLVRDRLDLLAEDPVLGVTDELLEGPVAVDESPLVIEDDDAHRGKVIDLANQSLFSLNAA
jgi:hypothetical protein